MKKLNRRRFLGKTLVTSTGLLAFPHIRNVMHAQNADKLGVAVVGVNGRGNNHISAYLDDARTVIQAIVDVDDKVAAYRAAAIAEKQGFAPKVVKDMREAFDMKEVRIMSTATPNHWHALAGVWAMQAGKDAYIEKPISHNIAEGSALVAAAKKYGRMCQVGTQCRSSAAIKDAIAWMNAGGIGTVKFARGLCYKRRKSIGALGNYAIPSEVDFNLWSGPATYTDPRVTRERFHYDWHWQRHYGNGDLGNQGPHQTDIARWGLGLDRHPNTIISYGGRLGYQAERNDPRYVDAGDTGNTEVSIYDYGDKCIVFETRGLSVDNSNDEELNRLFQETKGNKIGVVFYGSDGYLVQKSYSHCIAYDKNLKMIKEFKGGGDHFGNFLDACQSRNANDLNSDARVGHLSAGVSHLGNISYYLGEERKVSVNEARRILDKVKSLDDNAATLIRTVDHFIKNGVDLDKYPMSMGPLLTFDPDKEIFPGNPEASALLTRSYRPGFVCPTAKDV